jgi:prepilin peptidase CpaA
VSAAILPSPAAVDALLCLTALIALLVTAAISDVRWRRIGNRLCIVVAVLALPYWLVVEPHHPIRLLIQIAVALGVGIVLLVPFIANLLGGGDVKLMTALALWLPPASLIEAIMIVSIAGGVLGLILLIAARRRLAEPTVPYGVAIALAGIVESVQRIAVLFG